jgi:hypothetical protein
VLRPELDEFVTELSLVDTCHSPARSNAPFLYTARARELSSCLGGDGKRQPRASSDYPWKTGRLRRRVEARGGLFHQIARFGWRLQAVCEHWTTGLRSGTFKGSLQHSHGGP